jgi:hypothetical protein
MVEYLKSEKGYFYKLKKNGEKKRISQEEYYKKNKTNKIYKMKGGGNPRKLSIDFGITYDQTIGDCIKELIEASYSIYTKLLRKNKKITIVCGGQSPAYYCLAMMYFQIYDPELVNIVILPHSKHGQRTKNELINNENKEYCNRLREKNIQLNEEVVIIDGVHSGTGILALQSALEYCFPDIKVYKIAINAVKGVSQIPVNEEIILPCEPKFSDIFPRLVTSFYPKNFNNGTKFITEFINLDTNPVAEMIIDIARDYPNTKVEDTEWYKLNNEITEEIALKKEIREKEKEREKEGGFFQPIVLTNPKRYQCPICKTISGTAAVNNPENISKFTHSFNCPNKYKIPVENYNNNKNY